MGFKRTVPEENLYMHPLTGGQGIPSIVDQIHKQKISCMERCLRHNSPAKEAAEAMVERTFRQTAQSVDSRSVIFSGEDVQHAKNWYASAIEWQLKLDGAQFHVHNNIPEGPAMLSLQKYVKRANTEVLQRQFNNGLDGEAARADVTTLIDITTSDQGQVNRKYAINKHLSKYLDKARLPPIIQQEVDMRIGGMYLKIGDPLRVYEVRGALTTGQIMMRQWKSTTDYTTKKRKQVLKTIIVVGEHIEPVTTEDGIPVIVYVDSGEAQQLYARCICRQTDIKTPNKQRIDYISNETLRSLVRNPARTFVRNVTSPTFAVPYVVYTDGAFKWIKTNRQKVFLLAADEHKAVKTSAGAVIYKNQCVQERDA